MSSTRQRLEDHALTLFERHGYDDVTTAQIAQSAGVTQRTLFRHFRTKLDVLLGDVPDRTHEFLLALHRQPPDRPLVEALIDAIALTSEPGDAARRDVVRGRVLRTTASLRAATLAYEAELEANLARWAAPRLGRRPDDFDVRTIAAVFVACRRVVVTEWLDRDGRADVVALARRALAHVAT
jgi:AcrR family transcriptional regulator